MNLTTGVSLKDATFELNKNHVYYMFAYWKVVNSPRACLNALIYKNKNNLSLGAYVNLAPTSAGSSDWTRYSGRFSHTEDAEVLFRYGAWTPDNQTVVDAYMDNLLLIDLTAEFGAGNEPTKAWCDENIQMFDPNPECVTTTYAYDDANRLLSETTGEVTKTYSYDDNGNLTNRNGDTFTYDVLNRLVSAQAGGQTYTYTYDHTGLRTSKSGNGVYEKYVNHNQSVVLVLNSSNQVTAKYFRGINLISELLNGTYYLYNSHGDVVQLIASDGTVLRDYEYDAFGIQKDEEALDNNPFRYCGEFFDKETGLIYLRARYYDPEIGRFISEDCIRDGINWYIYCSGNPVYFIDPSGLREEGDESLPKKAQDDIDDYTALYETAKANGDYTSMAYARSACVKIRQMYNKGYVDKFDYTFGTGYSALDDGSDGKFMQTGTSSVASGYGSATTCTYYERRTNGNYQEVRLESFSYKVSTGSGVDFTGMGGRYGQESAFTFGGSTEISATRMNYSYTIPDSKWVVETEGTNVGVSMTFNFKRGTKAYSTEITNNIGYVAYNRGALPWWYILSGKFIQGSDSR